MSNNKKKYRQTTKGYLRNCFHNIQQRCNNPKTISYKYYGAKGVKCLFKSFDSFYHYVAVDLGLIYEDIKDKEIHRINDGNYEPGEIKFLTPVEHRAKHKAMRAKHKDFY